MKVALERSNELKILVKNKNAYPEGGNSYDIACLMKQMYKDDFICVSVEKSSWYYFDREKHRWFLDDQGHRLKCNISTEIWQLFKDKGTYYDSCIEDSEDKTNEGRRDNCQATCKTLKTTSTKANIMSECKELFYDTNRVFLNKLDNNNKFLGFNNGIYDLVNDEFRDGKPEDYISLSTGINYSPISDWQDSGELEEINDFLRIC